MAIYMPPLCRKKKVIERYDPDTFRVISQDAEDTHQKNDFVPSNEPSEWRKQWLDNSGLALPDIYNRRTEVLSHSAPDYRAHKPHPGSCGFLRYNVRFLNEPVCSVFTEDTRKEQHDWWPSRISTAPLQEPPKTRDTIYRADFSAERDGSHVDPGSTRHTANPNKESALGIVPVNFLRARDGKHRLFREKISYEHQYNSRKEPNYPIRSKHHGSFVWDPMSKEKTKKFVEHYQVISPEEGVQRQEREEAERLATQAERRLLIESFPDEATTVAKTAPEPVSKPQAPVEQAPDKAQASVEQTADTGNAKPVSPKHSPKTSASVSKNKEESNTKEPTEVPVAQNSKGKSENDDTCNEPE